MAQRDIGPPKAGILLGLLVLSYAALSSRWLGFFEWSIDEGMYLMRARMMAQGFRLYEDIWFNHPPLLVQSIYGAFGQFGESVEVARLVVLAFACVGIVGVVITARELEGWAAGLSAGLLLTATPLFFSLSRSVMSTLPALSLATLAIGLALASRRYGRSGRNSLIIASGLAFGIGAAVKLIVAPLGLPILVALASIGGAERPATTLRRLALWGVAALIPLAASLAPYGPAILFEQTVGSVFGARSAFALDVVLNLQDLLEWSSEGHIGFAALGAYGIARGVASKTRWRVIGVWLIAALVSIMLQTPLWSHHLVMLVLPLAVGAGAGAVWAVGDLRAALHSLLAPDDTGAGGWEAFGAVSLLIFLLALPVAFKRNVESTRSDSEDPWHALQTLTEVTEPGDFVVTDSPMLAFRAGLLVPPNLCDPGAKRFASESLSLADVADDIVRYEPTAIVTWNERFAREANQALPKWLTDMGWRQIVEIDSSRARRIYLPPEFPPTEPSKEIGATWSGEIQLYAAEIDVSEAVPGGKLRVLLEWRSNGPTARPLTVFAHLEDGSGQRIAQHDNPSGRGVRPTDHWLTGESIRDVYDLDIPPETAPGSYRLRVGLYDPETGDGWPLESAPSGEIASAEGAAIVIEPVLIGARGDG